jgi:hypothetical protein
LHLPVIAAFSLLIPLFGVLLSPGSRAAAATCSERFHGYLATEVTVLLQEHLPPAGYRLYALTEELFIHL